MVIRCAEGRGCMRRHQLANELRMQEILNNRNKWAVPQELRARVSDAGACAAALVNWTGAPLPSKNSRAASPT
eukprot:2610508-Pleurochrysis_carterae.AAC.3